MFKSLKSHADLHLARKTFHVATVMIMFLCMMFLSEQTCWLIYFSVGLPLVLLDLIRQYSRNLNRILLKILGGIVRKTEVHRLTGGSYAILSIGLTYWLFPKPVSLLAVLFLALGDPTASFFGLLYGKTKLIGKKTLAGSVAAMSICALATLIFFKVQSESLTDWNWLSLTALSIVCGLIAASSELIRIGKLDDNFIQPLANAVLLSILFIFIKGVVHV